MESHTLRTVATTEPGLRQALTCSTRLFPRLAWPPFVPLNNTSRMPPPPTPVIPSHTPQRLLRPVTPDDHGLEQEEALVQPQAWKHTCLHPLFVFSSSVLRLQEAPLLSLLTSLPPGPSGSFCISGQPSLQNFWPFLCTGTPSPATCSCLSLLLCHGIFMPLPHST